MVLKDGVKNMKLILKIINNPPRLPIPPCSHNKIYEIVLGAHWGTIPEPKNYEFFALPIEL